MLHCHHEPVSLSVCQTLDELDFERGIWFAAQNNDIPRVVNLIGKGVNVNAEDKSGYTALHYASRNGHLELCKILLSQKADVNSLTKAGKASSLHRCASAGHLDVFKLLLNSGAIIDLKDTDGKTVLHRAAESGHKAIVEVILGINPKLSLEPDNRGNLPRNLCVSDDIKYVIENYKVQD